MRIGVIRFFMIFLLVSVVSCSASRQNGFVYRPAHAGPDVSYVSSDLSAIDSQVGNVSDPVPTNPANMGFRNEVHSLSAGLAKLVEKQVSAHSFGEKPEPKKLIHDMATAYSAENNITLTPKQLRKLDKYAAKMERKQQKRAEVEWGPKNNLEIFLLAAAGVGLVVAFFNGFGWFVFLVAALIYLYLKLLKN